MRASLSLTDELSMAIPILVQFVFRLTFGMGLAMAVTPPSLVTAGFYRVHLWVLMGLNTFASLALYAMATSTALRAAFGVAVVLTLLSYIGAVIWLYEKARLGIVALLVVMAGGLSGSGPVSLNPGWL